MEAPHIIILAAALLPAILLMAFMLWRDKQQPEPIPWLLRGFFYGVLSAFIASSAATLLMALRIIPSEYSNALGATFYAFTVAAIPEEAAKLLMLWLLLRRNPYFDEHLDGIVYAVCVGLGFAAIENIMYLFEAGSDWAGVAIARGLLSVPGHFFFAVLMGYYYSLVHFGHANKRNQFLVLGAPILAHGIYDSIAMTQEVTEGIEVIFTISLLLFCNELRRLGTRHIREMVDADRQYTHKV